MIHPTFIFFTIVTTYSLLIDRFSQTKVQVQLGTSYSAAIPTLFRNFQNTELQWFVQKHTNHSSSLCQIVVSKEGVLNHSSSLDYLNSSNLTQQDIRDQIVFKISDLLALRTFVDAITLDDLIFTFFASGQGVIYEISPRYGILKQKSRFILTTSIHPDDSYFVNLQSKILLITPAFAIIVDGDGRTRQLGGYQSTNFSITQVKTVKKTLYIGLGQAGLISYEYDSSNYSLSLIRKMTFSYHQKILSTPFAVDQFAFDPFLNELFILDYAQGILAVPASNLTEYNKIKSSKAQLLVSNCRNLVVLYTNIFVTCPQLIQINILQGKVQQIVHNSFYPYEMQFKQQRLLLYGRHNFAVYDLFGKVLDQYHLNIIAQKSMVIKDYLVTFGQFKVISSLIIPQIQSLQCYANNSQNTGKYIGQMRTQGICSEYTSESPYNNNQTEICTIQYPFQLQFQDSFTLDLTIELYFFSGWMLLAVIFGSVMAIKHRCALINYKRVDEEQFHELDSVSQNVKKEDKREELVEES